MTSHKLSIKLFADGVPSVAPDAFVPVFHSWIRDNALPGHLLIDVADYAHVPDGPGTLIVSHEANIHLDQEDGASARSSAPRCSRPWLLEGTRRSAGR